MRRFLGSSSGDVMRTSSFATIQRYKTIRTFFLKQNTQLLPQCPSSSRSKTFSRIAPIHTGVGLGNSLFILREKLGTRTFGTTSILLNASKSNPVPTSGSDGESNRTSKAQSAQGESSEGKELEQEKAHESQNFENYSRFYRRLVLSLPPMRRPTRDELLKVATGFWQRLRIRFKWFTIRSFRRFNADDMSAFFTWFLMSQTLWILVGTTTFFSVIFATANSLRLQENLARALSDYLTSETGITIIFESAIVPKWKDSRIAFKNVYISRRPPSLGDLPFQVDGNAGHRAAARYDIGNHPVYHGLEDDHDERSHTDGDKIDYTVFDLSVDSIDVTLSLWRWLDGKGLVADAVIKGVRGVLDHRYIEYDPEHPLDPASFRRKSQAGDFQLESLQLEDVLVTVYQPGGFRPYTASIFRADIKQFRKQWMFFDFLSAENVVGQFDNCLFSLHKPQSIGRTTEQDLKDGNWARMSRFRIDGVNIDHIQRGISQEGPISWITSGKVDAVFDIKFPHPDEHDINALLGELADAITSVASSQAARLADRIPGQRELAKPAISVPEDEVYEEADIARADKPKQVTIEIDLRFRDLKATVPMFTNELSYTNNALIRPIVAFINANRTLVPIHCRIMKDLSDFDGAWTMWETGLMDEIAMKVYDALAYHVTQANFNRRVKTVSLWSLQKTLNAALLALHDAINPMSRFLRELQVQEIGADLLFNSQ